MTLRDPKNPALWADGTPRSQGNAFNTSYVIGGRGNWRREQFNANSKTNATRAVEKARAEGKAVDITINANPNHIGYELQKKANQRTVSAKRVEERRAAGFTTDTIKGLSKKADRRREEA